MGIYIDQISTTQETSLGYMNDFYFIVRLAHSRNVFFLPGKNAMRHSACKRQRGFDPQHLFR